MPNNFLGRHHTEETKAKISLAKLGKHHTKETKARMSLTRLGRHHTKETKAKMREAGLGRYPTEETKAKMRLANLGKHLTEEHKAKMRLAQMGNTNCLGFHHTEETREKMSLAGKKKVFTDEHRANLSRAGKGRHPIEESLIKMRKAAKLRWLDPIYREALEEAHRRRWQDPVYREKLEEAHRQSWLDPVKRDNMVEASRLASHIRPTKPEIYLGELIESICPCEWAYVGDGQLIIGGKNPDFANINGKKQLIELWGNYWHKGEDPQGRINIFKPYGYKTLVIWECELEQPDEVLKRIARFTKRSWF